MKLGMKLFAIRELTEAWRVLPEKADDQYPNAKNDIEAAIARVVRTVHEDRWPREWYARAWDSVKAFFRWLFPKRKKG